MPKTSETQPFERLTTGDGSLSCFNPAVGEAYHNRAGAYTEALVNFVRPSGILERSNGAAAIRILDPCFGLGYNTWVCLDELLKLSVPPTEIHVTAIENDPEILKLAPEALNTPLLGALPPYLKAFEHNVHYRTHEGPSPENAPFRVEIVTPSGKPTVLVFAVFVDDLRTRVKTLEGPYHVVFHDAFSARRMPELWTVDLFRQYYRLVEPVEGVVITYSAAAAVRGGLMEAGFEITKTRPLGEKDGGSLGTLKTLCLENNPDLMPVSELEWSYLQTRAGIPYRDPDLDRSRESILHDRALEQTRSDRPSGGKIRALIKGN